MTREEFLTELRLALQGNIPQAKVNENLRYYENYIIEESRKGRTEEQVICDLGNPRLIAKTIIDTTGDFVNQNVYTEEEDTGWDIRYGRFRFNSWYGRLLLGAIIVLLLVLLVQIGILLLPIIGAVFMAGAILYVIFLIFSGNRK